MINVFAQSSRLRRCPRTVSFKAALIVSSAAILPATAWADCTPVGAKSGSTVTCTSNSPSYTNLNSDLTVNADGTAVVVAPLVIGKNSSLTLASGGTIQGSTAIPTVQFDDNATITNNGTITSSASGGSAIQVGINSTVTNNGTLTAASGTAAVSFTASTATSNASTGGTFKNGATAPTAVTGNIQFGNSAGSSRSTFINYFNTTTTATSTATYGLTGNVTGAGNMTIDNEGAWTGSLTQSQFDPVGSASSTVVFENGKQANFSGTIVTADATTLTNDATGLNLAGVNYAMALGNLSQLGSAGTTSSSLVNNGYLTIGSSSAPALVTINGSFSQSSSGTLNMFIVKAGTVSSTGTSTQPYSQIDAVGGTATLSGTLNVNAEAGTTDLVGAKYDLILADKGITGAFSKVNVVSANSTALAFISFGNGSIVTLNGTQQAYEFQVSRVGTYASVIQAAGAGTLNQLAVANALTPIVNIADKAGSTSTTNESTLIGEIDDLTITQATALFDQMSPAGLLSYANALHDEANNFQRAIWLRMGDQNSDHAEDGWWGTVNGQVDVSKATTDSSKQTLYGFNLGYDLSGPHHIFGVAGNLSFDSLKNAGSTLKGNNRDYALAAYGGYEMGPVHLTGQVGYNFGHLKTKRTLTLSTVTDTATGSASEHLLMATGTAGFMLHAGGYTVEPFAGIDYTRGKINGFTETGDGAAALTVLPINADRTDLLAGVSLTRSSGKFRPYLRAVYRSEIGHSGADTVSAYFDGNNATTFTVVGVPAARHEEDINAGVNWVFEDAGSLFVGYQGTLRKGYNSHGINLGIRLEF
ncbi:MAG: autotransporter domain-containing protein [Pseudomonadota bacterium]|nr:autotransporter domain-containing protein [Pseudomonadota bacterium]